MTKFDEDGADMLRGAIDVAKPRRVAGWIASPLVSLRDKTVSAFVGKNCVGSGAVNVVRPDLLWLVEDGYAGFDFPIELPTDQDAASIVIRLEHCDAVILQADTEVVRSRPATAPQPVPTDAEPSAPAVVSSQISGSTANKGGVVIRYGMVKRSSGAK